MKYDVIVVGGGPGGLSAACAAKKHGAQQVLVLERNHCAGGILNQCIHDGFGLIHYHETLTGPEYATRAIQEAQELGITIHTDFMVVDMTPQRTVTAISRDGLHTYEAGAVVLATGLSGAHPGCSGHSWFPPCRRVHGRCGSEPG